MERDVIYRGEKLAVFEWTGMREQDAESAIGAVEACFDAWPDKHVPAYPRLQLIAVVLSDFVRRPFQQGAMTQDQGWASLPRDRALETTIEAGYLHARGLRKLERRYKRELRARDEARLAAQEREDAERRALLEIKP